MDGMNDEQSQAMRRVLASLIASERQMILTEKNPNNVKRHLMKDRAIGFELAKLGFPVSTSLAYHRKQLGIQHASKRWQEYQALRKAKEERKQNNGKNKH